MARNNTFLKKFIQKVSFNKLKLVKLQEPLFEYCPTDYRCIHLNLKTSCKATSKKQQGG